MLPRLCLTFLLLASTAAGAADVSTADSAAPVVRQMLESDDPEIRAEGLDMLGDVPDVDSLELAHKAMFHVDAGVRSRSVERLVQFPADEVTSRLLDTLHTGTLFEIQVIEEMAPHLQPHIEPTVISVLEDEDAPRDRRVLAAYLTGCFKNTKAIEPLAKLVWQEDEVLAMASIQALGRMRNPATFPYLKSMLGHSSEELRWEAVHGVGNLHTDEALEALVAVATSGQEPNEMIRRQAVLYLGASNKGEAIPLLLRSMQYSQGLRDIAGEALGQLTGRRFGGSVIEWQRWFEEESRVVRSLDEMLLTHKMKEAAKAAALEAQESPIGVNVQSNLP